MTLLEINLTDVLLETDPDDKVVVWAPVLREGPDGQLVGSRRKSIPLTDGVGSDEVVPGPLMVQVQCKALSDARPREVVVPEEGPVTLTSLMDGVGAFTYAPPVVGQVAQYRNDAVQAVVDAEAARDVAVQAAGTVAGVEVTITEARDQAVTAVEGTRDSVVADVNLAGSTATAAVAGQVTAAEGHATTAGGHATQTADDRRQAGEDRTQTGLDRQAAAQSATDAATSATTAEGHKTTVQTALAGARLYSGTGFPTGVVTAPVGSIYTDTAATNGAIRWIKTSGTGNTGWTVEYGDTGWRDITSLADPTKWDAVSSLLNYLKIRRIGDFVHFEVRLKRLATGRTSNVDDGTMTPLPIGFRASYFGTKGLGTIGGELADFGSSSGATLGAVTTKGGRDWVVGESVRGTFVISTSNAWPITLPGTPG